MTLDLVKSKPLDQHSKRVAKSGVSDTEKVMKSEAKSGKDLFFSARKQGIGEKIVGS